MPGIDQDEEKIRWYLAALYLCDVAGMLSDTQQLKLAHMAEQCGYVGSWRSVVEHDLQLEPSFIEDVFESCQARMTFSEALTFVLRGLGCPFPEARARDALGDAFEG